MAFVIEKSIICAKMLVNCIIINERTLTHTNIHTPMYTRFVKLYLVIELKEITEIYTLTNLKEVILNSFKEEIVTMPLQRSEKET